MTIIRVLKKERRGGRRKSPQKILEAAGRASEGAERASESARRALVAAVEPKRELGGTQTELREPWRGIGRKGLQGT